jgi:hypothetical protein
MHGMRPLCLMVQSEYGARPAVAITNGLLGLCFSTPLKGTRQGGQASAYYLHWCGRKRRSHSHTALAKGSACGVITS